jgi:lipoprotein-anchoring transpeptidase ErfK/SrfK
MIALVAVLAAALVGAAPAAAATSTSTTTAVHAGGTLATGARLVSTNGRYSAAVESGGRLVVRTSGGRQVWATPQTSAGAALRVTTAGQLLLQSGSHVGWRAGTSGSGAHDTLIVRYNGVLALYAGKLLVWASNAPNRCPALSGKTFVVDISAQQARMCSGSQQLRSTPVTTGMSAYGYGTPTGTWSVYAKVRDTTLYPAAGGAYPVHYWMPYDGPYGMHDSPWQDFAYGSSLYKTRGSHGCTHVPGPMMAWLFSWAGVGTRVVIHG